MNPAGDISKFLTSRRARITPAQAGLPSYGKRRVPGLRREEVASLAGLSVEYYKRLERGSASGASDLVLEALSRALRLDDAERAHLFDLWQRVPEHDPRRPARVLRPRGWRRLRAAAPHCVPLRTVHRSARPPNTQLPKRPRSPNPPLRSTVPKAIDALAAGRWRSEPRPRNSVS